MRQAALSRIRELSEAFDDLIPVWALREGFQYGGNGVPFGSFYKGIYRARQQRGPAALTLMTAAGRPGQAPAYEDAIDPETGSILYHYRAGSPEQADNRALRAAHELQTPLIYFLGVSPGQYKPISPVFVRADDPGAGLVLLEPGLPFQDTQGQGIVSSRGARREQFAMVVRRLGQLRFRQDVLRAYRERCAVTALRDPPSRL